MPIISNLVPAGRILRDEATKKYTLVDIFEVYWIPKGEKEANGFFSVFAKVDGLPAGQASISIIIQHPNGKGIAVEKVEGNINPGSVTFTVNFSFVKMDQQGRYFFRVFYNDQLIPDENRFFFDVYNVL